MKVAYRIYSIHYDYVDGGYYDDDGYKDDYYDYEIKNEITEKYVDSLDKYQEFCYNREKDGDYENYYVERIEIE